MEKDGAVQLFVLQLRFSQQCVLMCNSLIKQGINCIADDACVGFRGYIVRLIGSKKMSQM